MRAQGSAAVAGVSHISGAHQGTAEVGGGTPNPNLRHSSGPGHWGPENENSATPGTPELMGLLLIRGPQGRVRSEVSSGPQESSAETAPRSPRWPQRGRPPAPAAPSSRGCRLWVRVRRPQGHIQAPDARTPAGKDPSGESARSPADLQTQMQDKSPRPPVLQVGDSRRVSVT